MQRGRTVDAARLVGGPCSCHLPSPPGAGSPQVSSSFRNRGRGKKNHMKIKINKRHNPPAPGGGCRFPQKLRAGCGCYAGFPVATATARLRPSGLSPQQAAQALCRRAMPCRRAAVPPCPRAAMPCAAVPPCRRTCRATRCHGDARCHSGRQANPAPGAGGRCSRTSITGPSAKRRIRSGKIRPPAPKSTEIHRASRAAAVTARSW